MTTAWPTLPYSDWKDTYQTLHMWTQVVGKIRLAHAAYQNHCWQTALYVTPRGLTTSAIPCNGTNFDITFDFVDHVLVISVADGRTERIDLQPRSVADFHRTVMSTLEKLKLPTKIWPVPVEVANPVPFLENEHDRSYDPDAVQKLHAILMRTNEVFHTYRGDFIGKSSPVHFFWGAFDLAVTRFSGHPNPNKPEDPVMGDAYSHAVISHGFWPGGDWPIGGRVENPIYYAYAVPEPDGFRNAPVAKPAAYNAELGEYILPYESVRAAADPHQALLDFMQQTYATGANAAGWDRAALERPKN